MNFDYLGIQGFDISTWQESPEISGDVDFVKMKNWGADFIIIKAGQGNWTDQDFSKNWRNSKGVLPRSPYFYYDNQYSPNAQANTYWSIISQDLEGVCWLDLEDRRAGVYLGWKSWYDFLNEFQSISKLPNDQIGIYTNFFYWNEYLRSATPAQREWFGQFPLWLASYPEDPFHPDYSNILCPLPWLSPLILQSGTPSIGLEVGVESKEIDYNQFNGDEERFNKYFKAPTGTSTGDSEVTMYIELKPSTTGEYRSIRSETNYPSTPHIWGGTSIANRILAGNVGKAEPNGFYVYNSDVYVGNVLSAKAGDKWWRVHEANGEPMEGWVAEIHKGVTYLTVRQVGDTPQPEPSFPPEIGVTIGGVTKVYIPK